ncbi:MAG: hypothetical protein AB7I04_18345 [Pseudomonadales bacterium]
MTIQHFPQFDPRAHPERVRNLLRLEEMGVFGSFFCLTALEREMHAAGELVPGLLLDYESVPRLAAISKLARN